MLHVPTTPIPESTGIPEWSLTDEHHHHHNHHHSSSPQQPLSPQQEEQLNHHDSGYFNTATEDNFFFLQRDNGQHYEQQQQQNDHDQLSLPPPPPRLPPPLMEPGLGEEENTEDLMLNNHEYNMTVDPTYETATRIFYATMQKFARQGYHRRTFLESWHLHSMYSKSQQILLGIPNAHSMVFLSGDDFMFTPQLVPQEMEFDWEEQQPLGMGDDGVMVMTAPAPEIMDENAWMRQQPTITDEEDEEDEEEDVVDHNMVAPTAPDLHNHQIDWVNWYRTGNLPLPPPSTVMDHGDDDDEDEIHNNMNVNNDDSNEHNNDIITNNRNNCDDEMIHENQQKEQGHNVIESETVEEQKEKVEENEDQTLGEQPSSIKVSCNNNSNNEVTQSEKGKEIIRINAEEYISSIEKDLSIQDVERCDNVLSYQSLADMIPPPPLIPPLPSSTTTTTAATSLPLPSTTATINGSYGSTIAERSLHHQQLQFQDNSLDSNRNTRRNDLTEKLLQFPLLRSSDRLANAALEAFELAEELASNKATFFGFLLYFVRIWQVLFLCAESLISIRRRPPLVPPFYHPSYRKSRKLSNINGDNMV
ncbi:hypothetical protein BDC45DRAFT_539397 [Circinella umbellata]|nr:hypothetical protein BDC45DRAFT_539397 [Circinella umbellata]